MRLPDGQQIAHRSSPYVDDVLLKHRLLKGALQVAQMKQRQVFRDAAATGKARLKGVDLSVGIARGCRQEEDARDRDVRGGQAQHEVVEQRVTWLHREASAAHREDQPLLLAGRVHAATTDAQGLDSSMSLPK